MTPKITRRTVLSLAASGLLAASATNHASAKRRDSRAVTETVSHPKVLVTAADRDSLWTKVTKTAWAREAYGTLKASVDHYVELCAADPQYLTSRLMMHWKTHSTQSIVAKAHFVRAEGYAPVPTPRLDGARDWATVYTMGRLESLKPYGDNDGNVWLKNQQTGQYEWVAPEKTGGTIRGVNQSIMNLAAKAAFVFYLTSDEKYARFGSDILWTYMDGFQYVQLPRDVGGKNQIIGFTSFEVIHEGIMPDLGLAYDFLHDYLVKQGKDVGMIQTQLKRMADRVINGGSAEGNWNLNQADKFVYPILSLEDNAAYADRKGRQYYVDILLNANLPAQKGITRVIREGYDLKTALWPEAPGYGFGTTPQMIQFAYLLRDDPAGKTLLEDPLLTRAVIAQQNLLYPNGYAVGLGDTTSSRISTPALELLIAAARKRGDHDKEQRLTALLQGEIKGGTYDRSKAAGGSIAALTQYVADLLPVSPAARVESRSYFGEPLNVLLQRNPAADPKYALAAALYGTKGGHVHANGLAVELYGAGLILGADPGRGDSYWTADHHEYYSQPVAHNTVIVNGVSTYAENTKPQHTMAISQSEPMSEATALSPAVSFTISGFHYEKPVTAEQQRTLAIIRTGPQSGFYVDVFRSRTKDGDPDHFHDYLYHNMGQQFVLTDGGTEAHLPLVPTTLLKPDTGLAKGYGYFKNERSLGDYTGTLRGTFVTQLPGESPDTARVMTIWMPEGQKGRTVFALDAPANHEVRAALPKEFGTMPMPTLLVRQQGEAWNRPFVAVYEPSVGAGGATIKSVRAARSGSSSGNLAACIVEGSDFRACVLQGDNPAQAHTVEEGIHFQGTFGTMLYHRDGTIREVYLGSGTTLGDVSALITPVGGGASASLRRTNDGWQYSSQTPLRVQVAFPAPAGITEGTQKRWSLVIPAAESSLIREVHCRLIAGVSGRPELLVSGILPAGRDQLLSLKKTG